MNDGAPKTLALDDGARCGLATDPLGVVQALYDAMDRRDVPAVLGHLDDHVQWEMHGPDTLPTAGLRIGKGEVERFFGDLDRMFERVVFEITDLFAKDDRVLALGFEHGVVRASSVRYESPLCHVWTVRRGKVARWRCFVDSAAVMAACAA